MARTRLQPGQPQLVQPSADRALVHFHGEPARHLGLQVHAAPAHNLVLGRIGARDDQRSQLSHLCRAQGRRTAGAGMRLQASDPSRIVTMNPVTQRLPVHAAVRRGPRRETALPEQTPALKAAEPAPHPHSCWHGSEAPQPYSPFASPQELHSSETSGRKIFPADIESEIPSPGESPDKSQSHRGLVLARDISQKKVHRGFESVKVVLRRTA